MGDRYLAWTREEDLRKDFMPEKTDPDARFYDFIILAYFKARVHNLATRCFVITQAGALGMPLVLHCKVPGQGILSPRF